MPLKFSGRTRPLTPRVVRNFRVAFLAVAGIISIVGIFFVVMGSLSWYRGWCSTEWPSVQGTVLSSEVHRSTGGRRSASRGSTTAHVQYAYRVGDRDYEGTLVTFRTVGAGRSNATATAERYPEGSAVTVHYHPDDPGLCVLETGWDWSNAIPVGVGLFAIAFCAVFMALTLRMTRTMIRVCEARP